MRSDRILFVALVCCAPLLAGAETLQFGGASRPTVIELFTSEGCSSCPPAEARLNRFADDPQLWKKYVPLAFHVDYWDRLGWKDRFADPRYSARQRAYAASARLRTVYTPAFVVNGRAWRPGWLTGAPPGEDQAPGALRVHVQDGQVTARIEQPPPGASPLTLNVALLGMGLESDIAAGENEGRHSRHEFVVLGWSQHTGSGPQWQAPLPAPAGAEARARRYALAVWLAASDSPAPLYAAGSFIADPFADEAH